MKTTISNIYIKDLFWIDIKKTHTSFGYKGLPKDVHFTISYNELSEDVNIHVTRNIGNPENKPRIGVVVISKHTLEKVGIFAFLNIVSKLLRPVDISQFLKEEENITFIPIESTEGEMTKDVEQLFIEHFEDITTVGKSRIRIGGQVEEKLHELVESEKLQVNLQEFSMKLGHGIESSNGGVLSHNNKAYGIVKFENKWYEYTNDVPPQELLAAVTGEDAARKILKQFKVALAKIRHAVTYQEAKQYDTPFRLVANRELERALDELNKQT